MDEEAIAWAASVLDEPVVDVAELTGGLTSKMLALTGASGARSVLRLMTNEPWRTHGPDLTRRERATQLELAHTPVPAPLSLGIDAEGSHTGVSAHLMSHLPGDRLTEIGQHAIATMAEMLAAIHAVRPAVAARDYQSWAWEAKWVVPGWTRNPRSWERAFEILAQNPPAFEPTFLHRDFGHHNLLWQHGAISGVVDWVETSTGPAWLDAAHAATNLAVVWGPGPAAEFIDAYGAVRGTPPDVHWLVMDTVGFLPPPGKKPFFDSPAELERLDAWLHQVVRRFAP